MICRLHGQTEKSKQIARLSRLRNWEAGLTAVKTLFQQSPDWDVFVRLQTSSLEVAIRQNVWRFADGLITVFSGVTDKSFKYQLLVFQAESLQIRKQYKEAIPIWESAREVWKRYYFTVPMGVNHSSVVDHTNPLCHCYLQVGDLTRARSVQFDNLDLVPLLRRFAPQNSAIMDAVILSNKRILPKWKDARSKSNHAEEKRP